VCVCVCVCVLDPFVNHVAHLLFATNILAVVSFSESAKRLAGKSISEISCFCAKWDIKPLTRSLPGTCWACVLASRSGLWDWYSEDNSDGSVSAVGHGADRAAVQVCLLGGQTFHGHRTKTSRGTGNNQCTSIVQDAVFEIISCVYLYLQNTILKYLARCYSAPCLK